MRVLVWATLSFLLLASIFISPALGTVYTGSVHNRDLFVMHSDRASYMKGESVTISGTVSPLKERGHLLIDVLDPSGKVHLATEIVPESDRDDGVGTYSYKFDPEDNAPVGIWSVIAEYVSEYMVYGRSEVSFRVKDSLDILRSPLLKVAVNGAIDGNNGEWALKYDSKEWKPFARDPGKIEGNVVFNAYYNNGILYAIFDVPDNKFDSKDFVEVGIDMNGEGEKFRAGDNVYIYRVFRDGTSNAFKLGSEDAKDNAAKQRFTAKADEAGDIRLQIFDADGKVVKVLDSLRDKTSTSYKGILGIAGLEVDNDGNVYVLDSDSGIISKFDPDGILLGSFGSLGTDFKEFIDPTGIALDKEGKIYVADTGNARVQKFDEYGKFEGSFGSMGLLSVGIAEVADQKKGESKRFELFESPESVVVGPSGNIYVVDRRSGSVDVFDSDGNDIKSFGSMVSPRGVATDSNGNIYVVEQGNNRILKFDQNGNTIKSWGTFGTEDGMFKSPYGIAIDSNNYVYVADSVNNRIEKFDSNGNFVAKWGARGTGVGQLIGPHGVAVDSFNNVYVADTGNHRIQKFDITGKFIREFGMDSKRGFTPESIAIDSDGMVHVTDPYNNKIFKFTDVGDLLADWGSEGVGAGQFRAPFGITLDKSGNIYVSDPFNKRIQKFDIGGNFLLKWGSSDIKETLSIDDIPKGDHYIAFDDMSHQPIGMIDAKLVEENGVGSYLLESGQIWKVLHIYRDTVYVKAVGYAKNVIKSWTPDGIVVDPYGNVYIVDRENEITKKFDSDGQLISKWGSSGSGDSEFSKPTAMDLDSANNVYIVDTGNDRIQKFDSEGNFIAKWGSAGTGQGQFTNPRGIAIDDKDNVYVLDNGNNRVQKFNNEGKFMTEWGSTGSSLGQFDNLSTEGIAVDAEGRVYIADLPGATKTSHWVAEVAIPLNIQSDRFGIFVAEGTYNDSIPQNDNNPNSVKIYDVYRNTWPAGAFSVIPETWAEARLIDLDAIKVQPIVAIDTIRACTNEVCGEVQNEKPVLSGSDIIVSASMMAGQAPYRFEYDRTKVTLQYSIDNVEWSDADSKFVMVAKDNPAAVNLKYTPTEEGNVSLRVTSSGLLTKESVTDPVTVKVQQSESFPLRADMKWSPDEIREDEPATFELRFTVDNEVLTDLNYDLQLARDSMVVADLPLLRAEDGKDLYRYTFKQAGSYTVKVNVIAIGNADKFMPLKKTFTYKIDVLPSDSPIKISTVQKGESMKITIKNREMSSLLINSISLSLDNIEKIDYKLPSSWTSSVNTGLKMIQFSAEEDPLTAGQDMEFIARSKAFATSLYSVCWDLDQTKLVLKLCQ